MISPLTVWHTFLRNCFIELYPCSSFRSTNAPVVYCALWGLLTRWYLFLYMYCSSIQNRSTVQYVYDWKSSVSSPHFSIAPVCHGVKSFGSLLVIWSRFAPMTNDYVTEKSNAQKVWCHHEVKWRSYASNADGCIRVCAQRPWNVRFRVTEMLLIIFDYSCL